ncbi:MAG: hypothetical protein Q8P67_05270 [archaeon]|nr:hypothetical protein [archaeon]
MGLPPDAVESDLQALAAKYGPIQQIQIQKNKSSALVHFKDIQHAVHMVEQSRHAPFAIRGSAIKCRFWAIINNNLNPLNNPIFQQQLQPPAFAEIELPAPPPVFTVSLAEHHALLERLQAAQQEISLMRQKLEDVERDREDLRLQLKASEELINTRKRDAPSGTDLLVHADQKRQQTSSAPFTLKGRIKQSIQQSSLIEEPNNSNNNNSSSSNNNSSSNINEVVASSSSEPIVPRVISKGDYLYARRSTRSTNADQDDLVIGQICRDSPPAKSPKSRSGRKPGSAAEVKAESSSHSPKPTTSRAATSRSTKGKQRLDDSDSDDSAVERSSSGKKSAAVKKGKPGKQMKKAAPESSDGEKDDEDERPRPGKAAARGRSTPVKRGKKASSASSDGSEGHDSSSSSSSGGDNSDNSDDPVRGQPADPDIKRFLSYWPKRLQEMKAAVPREYRKKDCQGSDSDVELDTRRKSLSVDEIYGEVEPRFISQIVRQLDIQPKDSFIDIGSGIGNVCFQVVCQTGCRAIGIEIREDLYKISLSGANTLKRLVKRYVFPCKKTYDVGSGIQFINGDATDEDQMLGVLTDANYIFINNWRFTSETIHKLLHVFRCSLRDGTRVVTLKNLFPRIRKSNEESGQIDIFKYPWEEVQSPPEPVSWDSRPITYYIYEVNCKKRN